MTKNKAKYYLSEVSQLYVQYNHMYFLKHQRSSKNQKLKKTKKQSILSFSSEI